MIGVRLGSLVFMALWAYCVFDVIRSPEGLIRELPKMVWLLIVFFVPVIGGVAWLLLGRPEGASLADPTKPREAQPRRLPPGSYPLPPDEDPDFLRRAEQRAHELKRQEELRRWEEERRRRKELAGGDDPELEGTDNPELGDGGDPV